MPFTVPEEVWLTSLATDASPISLKPRKNHPAPTTSEDQPAVVVLDGASRLALTGYAVRHKQVYEFMARLKESAAFERVDLLKADKEQVLWSEAVRFELMCTW